MRKKTQKVIDLLQISGSSCNGTKNEKYKFLLFIICPFSLFLFRKTFHVESLEKLSTPRRSFTRHSFDKFSISR